jgi:phosphoribosylpyrophosphate synthetase
MDLIGVNIPAPKVRISKNEVEDYVNLYRGIRDRKDTVTWRTLVTTIRRLLGEKFPDYKKIPGRLHLKGRKLINQLVKGTYLESLVPEIEYAVGIRGLTGRGGEDLDFLLLSGKYYPETLLWTLADYIKSKGKKVAVVNPVGNYNDGQTRVIGPLRFFRNIKRVVILASTQSSLGGSVSVLSNVIHLLRNPEFSKKVKNVDVVIPMYGGSRGHRAGQSEEVGFEVMEAGFNAKLLSLPTKDLLMRLGSEVKVQPTFKFYSVDIHSVDYPSHTFEDQGFDFVSIDPCSETSLGIIGLIRSKKMVKVPIRLIACDKGATARTQKLAGELMADKHLRHSNIQIVYIEKKRLGAGQVLGSTISAVEEWSRMGKRIKRKVLRIPQRPNFRNTILIYSDDMIDTGGTAEKDFEYISSFYPNSSLKIFVATHPVFSKGFGALKRIGADYFVLGNTLTRDGLEEIKGVISIDLAPAIYSTILAK